MFVACRPVRAKQIKCKQTYSIRGRTFPGRGSVSQFSGLYVEGTHKKGCIFTLAVCESVTKFEILTLQTGVTKIDTELKGYH